MQDPEFEKQVRQKMDELKFRPSDAVWSNVAKEINKDRKKRPLLWLFLFLLIGVAGSYYLFSYQSASNNKNYSTKQSVAPSSNTEKKNSDKNDIDHNEIDKQSDKGISSAVPSNNQSTKTGDNNESVSEKIKQNQNAHATKQKAVNTNTTQLKQKNSKPVAKKTNNPSNKIAALALSESAATELNTVADDTKIYFKDSAKKQESIGIVAPVRNKADTVSNKNVTSSVAEQKKSTEKSKNEKAWKIGFSGNLGASTVFQNLFKSATYANYALYSATPVPLVSTASSYPTSASIKPGISFSAGALVEKQIGKRLFFSAGIQYHYYSIKVETGNKVDSTIVFTNPSNGIYYLTPASAYGAYSNSTYYRSVDTIVSNTHTNHYHFLEIPVSVLYQLSKSKKAPVFWELGVSLAELIGSDELHFNSANGTYSKDNSFFNKTQVNLNTAFLVGLHHNNLYFQLGPQLQYGITNLLSTKADGNEHLFFGGVKIVLIPNRK